MSGAVPPTVDTHAGAGGGAGAGAGAFTPTPTGHHRRSSSNSPAVHNPDAGRKGKPAHLFHDKMVYHVDTHHPRTKDEHGSRMKIPLCCGGSSVGYHALPWQDSPVKEAGDLTSLGIGIILYFKFLKYMALLYFILSLLAVPSLVIYSLGGKLDAESQLSFVSGTTIGNLGESKIMCEAVNDDNTLRLACADGAIIGRVEAYYGQPTGSCSCPLAQQPSPLCPASVLADDTCAGNGACHLDPIRDVNLPSGESFGAAACCAKKLDANSLPDFSDLDIKDTSGCSSPSAQVIMSGMCAGKQSCQLVVDPVSNYTWLPDATFKTYCPGQDSVVKQADGTVANCTDNFSTQGGLASCAGGRFAVRRLMVVAQCFDTHINIGGTLRDKAEMIVLVGVFDFVSSLVFLFAWLYLQRKEGISLDSADANATTASDYTIAIWELPPVSMYKTVVNLKEMLRKHIETSLTENATPVTDRLGGVGGQPRLPVKIADINFGMSNSQAIETLKLHGTYVHKLEALENSYRILVSSRMVSEADSRTRQMLARNSRHNLYRDIQQDNRNIRLGRDASSRLVPLDFANAYNKLQNKLVQLRANVNTLQMHRHRQRAVVAYVTFEEEEGALRAQEYWPSNWGSRFMQPNEKRLQGSYRVNVTRAPEPSDIYWENLELGWFGRLWRSSITLIVSLLLVFITIVLMFIAESSKRENLRKFPAVDCNNIIDPLNKTLVVQDVLWEQLNQTTGNVGRLECYCKKKLFSGSLSDVFNEDFGLEDLKGSRKWCQEWLQTWSFNRGITYAGVFGVLLINVIMRNVLKSLVEFERPRTKTAELVSVGTKLFFVQVLNTAFIVLLVNARIRSRVEWLRTGEYDDFSTSWFSSVGVSLILTMTFNIFIPHGAPLGRWMQLGVLRCCDRSCTCDKHYTKKRTQDEYNKRYTEQHFRLSERYAAVLNTMFVTMAYSTGMPLLVPLAFVSTLVSFWVDKFFLLRATQTPPHLSAAMSQRATALMPLALVIHLMLGIWMLGNSNVIADEALSETLGSSNAGTAQALRDTVASFDKGWNLNVRLFGEHVLPMFLLLLVIILSYSLWKLVLSRVPQLVACCGWCRRGNTAENLHNYFDSISESAISKVLREGIYNVELWKKYVTTHEKWLYRGTVMRYLDEHGRDLPEPDPTRTEPPQIPLRAHRLGLRTVANFRQTVANAADEGVMVATQYYLGPAYTRRDEVPAEELEDFFTDEEVRAFQLFWPDPAKLMPEGHHSYDIHESPEYRSMFALNADLSAKEKLGLRQHKSFRTLDTSVRTPDQITIAPAMRDAARRLDQSHVLAQAVFGGSSRRMLGGLEDEPGKGTVRILPPGSHQHGAPLSNVSVQEQ